MEATIHICNGESLDEHGEPRYGFYFEIVAGTLTGPYNSGPEAEAACQQAFDRHDY